MLLAIDTATQILSIALHDGDELRAECSLSAGRQHSALLAPMIKQIMTQIEVNTGDLTALAVAIGPGSYTGLRIGVALAKGMAAVNDLPLVPATTLDIAAAAQDGRSSDETLIATVPAGRNRAIWAEYLRQSGHWRERRPAQISSWPELLAGCSRPGLISGEITGTGLKAIRDAQKSGDRIRLLPAAERLRRAGYLAEIAWRRLRGSEAHRPFPADQVMPIYLKSPG
ncbi:MAG: tRNA (adenosine(37)-N6)-threonylcarbamoyltransferase complex dimerization subunit type 1 TsaB [Chloroflexi bacterium]|nr:tRNA (adenosine(37)-N6)-threonylcarbamoyltransferase complex dimerization subunit type 1 TsaB [Chloroflexota bacterium]